jgi:hypothetical protein
MMIHPKTRDLARRLLEYEAMAAKPPESPESATLVVYEKLRQSLGAFAGVAAFESLAFRALTQAKSEAPDLWTVQVAEDGSLQGLGEFEPKSNIETNRARDDQAGGGGMILISRLLGLLLIFLGEALTFSLLRVTWPHAAFDDSNSEHGRKA